MNAVSIPCIALAALNAVVGAYYLYLARRRPDSREYLPFALLCLSAACYDFFCAGLYDAESVSEGVFWQRLQLDTLMVIAVLLTWFTGIFTGRQGDRFIKGAIAWFALLFLAALLAGPALTLSADRPAVAQIEVRGLPMVTYYEAAPGIIYHLAMASAVVVYLYLFWCVIAQYRRTRRRLLLPVLAGLVAYFAGVINDSLVSMRAYQFIYISEYVFLFIVVAMAYAMLENFVAVHAAYERLNAGLEQQVRDRTDEIVKTLDRVKHLEGIIPICMYCKKIRDDHASWHRLETYISEHSDAMFSHGVCPECKQKFIRDYRQSQQHGEPEAK
ncbi:MAG TPA: histidine kinase N-terminal 7TM domain-containing protein [Candidatus Edwardsbacteria bacterium]|nr:histidine kinase N-terminal 7TM domain-containing protein [Candidatus Edwardsbacteria bacterium]